MRGAGAPDDLGGQLLELRRRRQAESPMVPPDASFDESVAAHLNAVLDRPDWARLVVWQALGDCPFTDSEEGERFTAAQRSMTARVLEGIRRRQRAGEVTGGIDPAFALLVAYAVVFSPITMPQFVRDIFGEDPLAPSVRQRLHEQLVKLLGTAED
ncbi:hypothetical protein GCM10023191_058140 [Actinoallomurus oryzae]|uniref:HTH-type transcriptional repressor Sco4008 C-terminal domain-containing protein n=1 Tax=Actinoallomurus oryzae TaxID=502180 RepID=A0ABP8QJE1_9ACTN